MPTGVVDDSIFCLEHFVIFELYPEKPRVGRSTEDNVLIIFWLMNIHTFLAKSPIFPSFDGIRLVKPKNY